MRRRHRQTVRPTSTEVEEQALDAAEAQRVLYYLTADPRTLDDAIHAFHVALGDRGGDTLGDRSRDTPERTSGRDRLGQCLIERYQRTGDLNSLEWGLRHRLDAVEATPDDDAERHKRLRGLADGLLMAVERFEWGEAPELVSNHLRNAVGWLEESIAIGGGVDEWWKRSSLGNALRLRFEHFGEVSDLDLAFTEASRAVDLVPAGDRVAGAACRGNLGAVAFRRFEERGDDDDRAAAAAAFREAADLSPAGSRDRAAHLANLAVAGETDDETVQAIAASVGSELRGADVAQVTVLGDLAARAGRWPEAAEAYAVSQERLARLVGTQTRRALADRVLRLSVGVAARLAYAMALLGDPAAAATALEQGRARLLSQSLASGEVDIDAIRAAGRNDLADDVEQAAAEVRRVEVASADPDSATAVLGGEGVRLRRKLLDDLVDLAVRETGVEDARRPLSAARLRSVAAGQPLVYLASAPEGGLAVIVRGDLSRDIETVVLPALADRPLREHIVELFRTYDARRSDQRAWMETLDDACRWQFEAAMEPVLGALDGASAATLIPCGWLAFLPLHAAWEPAAGRPSGRRYALDDMVISYAPNARALGQSAQRPARPLAADVVVVADPQPSPPGAAPLPFAAVEADHVRALLPEARLLRSADATGTAVRAALRECSLAHLACHAEASSGRPLRTALFVAGGERIEAHELLAARLDGARLVVLSACETAAVGRGVPDEVVGLPAALLQAGAAGVVASLWEVPDRSTALLMARLYEGLVTQNRPPAVALRAAQAWLRDATNEELVEAGYGDAADGPEAPALRELWGAARPFAHPYYWSAFTLVGT